MLGVFLSKVDYLFIIRATIFCCPNLTMMRTVSTAGSKKQYADKKHRQTSRHLKQGLEMPYVSIFCGPMIHDESFQVT